MTELKLYIADSNVEFDENHAEGVIAESEKEARAHFSKVFKDGFEDYTIEEFPLVRGLRIWAFGYDSAGLGCELPAFSDSGE